MKNFTKHIFPGILFLLLAGAWFPAPLRAGERTTVFVSIPPQRYFVEQIGKGLVDVRVMVQPGASPHTYEPRPRQMVALAKAKLYFAIGIAFERANLEKIVSTNPEIIVVHTDHGIHKIPMPSSHHHDEVGDHHDEGQLDPHIWLSPSLVQKQARTILHALKKMDPSHGKLFEAGYLQFLSRIDDLDGEMERIFAGKKGLSFMVFHPSWGYFAQAYGLKQIPIELEGKNPKPAQLKALIKQAREKSIRVVFVQPQFSSRSAELIAGEIGGQVVYADPLAEDWMANLRTVADKFKAALR